MNSRYCAAPVCCTKVLNVIPQSITCKNLYIGSVNSADLTSLEKGTREYDDLSGYPTRIRGV